MSETVAFCELSGKFEKDQWIYFGVLFVPMMIIFMFIYKLLRIPIKNWGVMFSVTSSAITYSGLGAIYIYSTDIGTKYGRCDGAVSDLPLFNEEGENFGDLVDEVLGWYWIGMLTSMTLYFIFFILSLKVDVQKYVYGVSSDGVKNKIKSYVLKLITIMVKFALGAIYIPFFSIGYDEDDDGDKCLCVDDYTWTISVLYSMMLLAPFVTKASDALGKIDEFVEIKPKKWTKFFDGLKFGGKYFMIFAYFLGLVGMLLAGCFIFYMRAEAIIVDLAGLRVTADADDQDAALNILRLDYLIFITICLHVVAGVLLKKYLNGSKDSKCCYCICAKLCPCCISLTEEEKEAAALMKQEKKEKQEQKKQEKKQEQEQKKLEKQQDKIEKQQKKQEQEQKKLEKEQAKIEQELARVASNSAVKK